MELKIDTILSNGFVLAMAKTETKKEQEIKQRTKEENKTLFDYAIKESLIQINELKKIDNSLSDYLLAQELMINDPLFYSKVVKNINDGLSVFDAINSAMDFFMDGLKASSSTYLKERVLDMEDMINRLFDNINSKENNETDYKYILFVDELKPTVLIQNKENILGVVAKKGGYTSHSAILARSWDIPYVIVNDFKIKDFDTVIIDTRKKTVEINPKTDEFFKLKEEYDQSLNFNKKAVKHSDSYLFLANVASNLDIKRVNDYEFDGIGLYRTELIFMNSKRPYSFLEQYQIYSKAVLDMNGKPVCFRTFDVGDDKQMPYLKTHKKGIDNYKNNPVIFEDQIRALLQANKYSNMKIMFPMIESKEEFLFLRDWVLSIKDKYGYRNEVKIGMMLETKTALKNITDFTDTDFISIGTNDLTEELYGIKRENATKDLTYTDNLINELKDVVDFCSKNNICLSVCGELASIKEIAVKFYNIGIRNLSVSPAAIQHLNSAYTEFNK